MDADRLSITILVFFIFLGAMYIYGSYRVIRNKRASVRYGNQFNRTEDVYDGQGARRYGLLNALIGIFSIIWGFIVYFGLVNGAIAFLGCVGIFISTFLAVFVLTAHKSDRVTP